MIELSGQQADDRRGVSHVIGTVLMIAIVVVLVGAVGAYVTGANYVDTAGGTSGDATSTGTILEDQAGSEFIVGTSIVLDRRAFVEAGTSDDLTGTTHLDLDGATVHIFWESEDGARTTTLYTCERQGSVCTNRE